MFCHTSSISLTGAQLGFSTILAVQLSALSVLLADVSAPFLVLMLGCSWSPFIKWWVLALLWWSRLHCSSRIIAVEFLPWLMSGFSSASTNEFVYTMLANLKAYWMFILAHKRIPVEIMSLGRTTLVDMTPLEILWDANSSNAATTLVALSLEDCSCFSVSISIFRAWHSLCDPLTPTKFAERVRRK